MTDELSMARRRVRDTKLAHSLESHVRRMEVLIDIMVDRGDEVPEFYAEFEEYKRATLEFIKKLRGE